MKITFKCPTCQSPLTAEIDEPPENPKQQDHAWMMLPPRDGDRITTGDKIIGLLIGMFVASAFLFAVYAIVTIWAKKYQ